jgi:hypothetical protein
MIPANIDRLKGRLLRILDRAPSEAVETPDVDLMHEAATLTEMARTATEQGNAIGAQIMSSLAREFRDRAFGVQAEAA